MAFGGEPFGEVAGDVVVGGEPAGVARARHPDRVFGAAVQEPEVDDEDRAEDPEQQRNPQLAQQVAVEVAAVGGEDGDLDRAEQEDVVPDVPDRRIGEVGPEGDEGGDTRGGQRDPEQDGQIADPESHRGERGGDARQPGQGQVEGQHPEDFPVRFQGSEPYRHPG